MKTIRIILTVTVILLVIPLKAQHLEGKVFGTDNSSKKEPLVGVNIYWEATQSANQKSGFRA